MSEIRLDDIKEVVKEDMKDFEKKFRDSMKSNVMLLDKIMSYIVKRNGKQMRPMFVFLSAHLIGEVNESTQRGAALIELLHTATLVHDDVVDDSNYRRGLFSINALWKNKIAVLVGDYLLSRGLLLAIDHGDFQLLKIVSNAVREMSEGELLQIEKARNLDITEDVYYEIIRQKTASLIASCCAVGVASTGADDDMIEKAKLFGEKVGMAFQVKDDLFDYETTEMIGKPVGIDIKERKMTLPLIYALNKASWLEKKRIMYIIKNKTHKADKVREVLQFVRESGGIEYTRGVMEK
ncbi:MAG: polyprenyl synthetase family protein, partial [Cytophagales bacterium]|nr:polyprenyl synthetase family protein [Cytophaga sp.]